MGMDTVYLSYVSGQGWSKDWSTIMVVVVLVCVSDRLQGTGCAGTTETVTPLTGVSPSVGPRVIMGRCWLLGREVT